MTFDIHPISEKEARAILTWRYEPPYELYNPQPADLDEDLANLLDPQNNYFSVFDKGELIAFRCFGADARVAGGNYEAEALDMGGGLRPNLTGHGLGPQVMQAAVDFAHDRFHPPLFRVTVAQFNLRAQKACLKVGYQPVDRFTHPQSGRDFVIMIRPAIF